MTCVSEYRTLKKYMICDFCQPESLIATDTDYHSLWAKQKTKSLGIRWLVFAEAKVTSTLISPEGKTTKTA